MKRLLILFAILLIISSFIWLYVFHKPKADYKTVAADYTIYAEQLYKEYSSKAGQQYTGKILAVSGTATGIESNDSIFTVVFVFNEGMFGDEGIRCVFLPEYNNELKKINFPAHVNLKGFCAGYNETDIIIEHCSFVE